MAFIKGDRVELGCWFSGYMQSYLLGKYTAPQSHCTTFTLMLCSSIFKVMEKKRNIRRLDGPARRIVQPVQAAPVQAAPIPEDPVTPETPIASVAVVEPVPSTETIPDLAQPSYETLEPKTPLWRRFSRRNVVIVASLLLVVVTGVGIKAVVASQNVMTKNTGSGAPALEGEVDPTKLRGEGDGRINVLLLGVGNQGHNGGKLSDTIMVASIDPVNKNMAMLSIPRDLYVRIPGYGFNKINAANSLGGPDLAKEVVSRVLDMPIHYYAQVDFSGFKQAVDSVGGVEITNKEKLYDSQYPCENERGYCTFKLDPGTYQMNGTLALKYARCRHGSCGNDFGRSERQQQLLVALREKSLQASTLTNPVKISGLLDSVGGNVRTDFELKELQKMGKIIKDIDISKAVNKVLDTETGGLLKDGGGRYAGAGSILLPKAGDFNYSEIQELSRSIFVDGYIVKEKAKIEVQNGTLRPGVGTSATQLLKAYSYNVESISTAPHQKYTTSQIIDRSGGKNPYTVRYLETRFKTKALKEKPLEPAEGQPMGPDIVIIVGADYKATQ